MPNLSIAEILHRAADNHLMEDPARYGLFEHQSLRVGQATIGYAVMRALLCSHTNNPSANLNDFYDLPRYQRAMLTATIDDIWDGFLETFYSIREAAFVMSASVLIEQDVKYMFLKQMALLAEDQGV